jgi:hypothetical protein
MSISYDLGRVVGNDGAEGQDGTTFILAVATNGDLSWSNEDGKTNPATVNIQGPPGEVGQDFVILGYYATLSILQAAVTNPEAGAAYGVGSAAPYDIYIWDGVGLSWLNNGIIEGPPGEKGDTGDTGAQGPVGPNEVSSTTDSSLSGIIKGAAGKLTQAVAGSDYQAAITASGILKGAGGGAVNAATAGTDYQAPTDGLTAEVALADADTLPFYDDSATAHRKSTWANIKSVLKTALFGSVSGLTKLDGSGGFSAATSGTDFQGPTEGLTAESSLADADVFPFYDNSAIAHRKVTWGNILAAIVSAIVGVASKAASLDSNSKVTASQAAARIIDVTDNKTLALSDAGTMQRLNSASNLTVTVPLESSVAYPDGTEIEITRYGTGTCTIAAASGVTINKNGSALTIKDRYTSAYLKKIADDEWLLQGNLG